MQSDGHINRELRDLTERVERLEAAQRDADRDRAECNQIVKDVWSRLFPAAFAALYPTEPQASPDAERPAES